MAKRKDDKQWETRILNWSVVGLIIVTLYLIGCLIVDRVESLEDGRTTAQNDFISDEIRKYIKIQASDTIKVPDQLKTLQEKLDAAIRDPNNLARVSLQTDIKHVSDEVKSLRDALGSDVERSLSVPLLRKDVQRIEEQLEKYTLATSKEIDRVYDQNKWFLGLMGTMALSLLGLAISNLLQSRRKEVTSSSEVTPENCTIVD